MTGLPRPVTRFLELATRESPPPFETVALETAGLMRRPGLPGIPLRIRMSHRLGYEFAHQIRVGAGRLSLELGLDGYVDGRGLMKVGPAIQAGPEFDQGALIALWGEALVFRCSWEGRTDVRWDAIDAAAARLVVAGPAGELPMTVTFDPRTGWPTSCDALRHKGVGPLVGWRATYGAWRRYPDGVLAPGRVAAAWADEPRPWLELSVERLEPGAAVEDALGAARRALARSRTGGDRAPTSPGRTRP
jgi:hypothetical protein